MYLPLLFPKGNHVSPLSGISRLSELNCGFPLGAIDSLNLVASLVKTLTSLWDIRSNTALKGYSSFRFGGLGLLQARRNKDLEWTTILAYCGGTEYLKGRNGRIDLSNEGRPTSRGKCGHMPLIIGIQKTCSHCRKLLCDKCGFCTVACREQGFKPLALDKSLIMGRGKKVSTSTAGEVTPWDPAPMGNYEDYF